MESLKIITKDGLGKTRIRSIVLFTLATIDLIWTSNFNLESNISPKWFWQLTWETRIWLKNTWEWLASWVFLLKISSCAFFEKSRLKLLFHWNAHLRISSKSPLRLLVVVSNFLTVEKRPCHRRITWGQTEDYRISHWYRYGKIREPTMEPWGTPVLTLAQD